MTSIKILYLPKHLMNQAEFQQIISQVQILLMNFMKVLEVIYDSSLNKNILNKNKNILNNNRITNINI